MFHKEATWEVMSKGFPARAPTWPQGDHRRLPRPGAGTVRARRPQGRGEDDHLEGPHRGDRDRGRGKLKNGKDYDNLYVWVYEIKDGKVWKLREYMDSHYIANLAL